MDPKLEEKIKNSGNNLVMRVVGFLEKLNWTVDLSTYYYDDTTEKPREIDIIASKHVKIIEDRDHLDSFKVNLFIECKHFLNDVAFWLHDNDKGKALSAIKLVNMHTEGEIKKSSDFQQHHYLTVSYVGKLSDALKDDENSVFNAITQPVKSLIFFKENNPVRGIYYPITIYSGISGIQLIDKQGKVTSQEAVIYGLYYSYRFRQEQQIKTEYFCVDFVHENRMSDFFKRIDGEVSILENHLRNSAIDATIASQARVMRNNQNFRNSNR
ncbi:MAG: hypothetical protein AAB880_01045 [Patescibacteria group bacterium]